MAGRMVARGLRSAAASTWCLTPVHVHAKCATIVDLNRRRASNTKD